MSIAADLVVLNAQVFTLDPRRPTARALAVHDGRVLYVGDEPDVRALCDARTRIIDAEGGAAIPAFHDAHLHFLSYARARSRVDCRAATSIAEVQRLVCQRADTLPPGAWVRAVGYDEARLAERRHPTRWDLDAAAPQHLARLQHRTRHLDVINTAGLQILGLLDGFSDQIEHDPDSGEPTGRIYNGADLLRRLLPPDAHADLAADVRAASDHLLTMGVTTVQDATYTNGPAELALFQRLASEGHLHQRVFLFRGVEEWQAMSEPMGESARARLGPIKIMLDEATTDADEIRRVVAEARGAGESVAFHAVSEAELAIALDALRRAPPHGPPTASVGRRGPDRIEHGAVIPESWIPELAAAGVCVVGQPGLIAERGDVYASRYPSEQHGWLHRARSLIEAGIPYAASSDAPITEPDPLAGLVAARRRLTPTGVTLGADEALSLMQALAAFTAWPARAIGVESELGMLRPGARADIAILDPDLLETTGDHPGWTTRYTLDSGRIVWQRGGAILLSDANKSVAP
jgi:predicted amidohydrolase YtcJ